MNELTLLWNLIAQARQNLQGGVEQTHLALKLLPGSDRATALRDLFRGLNMTAHTNDTVAARADVRAKIVELASVNAIVAYLGEHAPQMA